MRLYLILSFLKDKIFPEFDRLFTLAPSWGERTEEKEEEWEEIEASRIDFVAAKGFLCGSGEWEDLFDLGEFVVVDAFVLLLVSVFLTKVFTVLMDVVSKEESGDWLEESNWEGRFLFSCKIEVRLFLRFDLGIVVKEGGLSEAMELYICSDIVNSLVDDLEDGGDDDDDADAEEADADIDESPEVESVDEEFRFAEVPEMGLLSWGFVSIVIMEKWRRVDIVEAVEVCFDLITEFLQLVVEVEEDLEREGESK